MDDLTCSCGHAFRGHTTNRQLGPCSRCDCRIWTRDGIDAGTRSVAVGPLELDVAMARDHGWSEKRIRAVAREIQAIATGRRRSV